VERTVTLRDQLKTGLIAGAAAGVLMDVFLFGSQIAGGTPADKLAGNFMFIAAALVGPASATPVVVALAVALDLCVAMGWALGYVYLARTQAQLLVRPAISGAVFGFIVYAFMEIILINAGLSSRVTSGLLFRELIAETIFYGIPVALIVSRLVRPVVAHPSTSSAAADNTSG
jgi:hypothetical protein